MRDDDEFGRQLRQLRRARDLTQQDLAQAAFCALDTIKKLESGRRRPSRQMAIQLADVLGLDAAERAAFLAATRQMLLMIRHWRPRPARPSSCRTISQPNSLASSGANRRSPTWAGCCIVRVC